MTELAPRIENSRAERPHTHFFRATVEGIKRHMPEHSGKLQSVLEEIDREAVDNFTTWESNSFPGVKLPYTTLSVTPNLVRKLASLPADSDTPHAPDATQAKDAADKTFYLFPPWQLPPDGGPFTPMDGGINLYFKQLVPIAQAIRAGERPPRRTIVLVGSPASLGGHVTKEFLDALRSTGYDAHGKVAAELVEAFHKDHPDERIVLNGISRGVSIADKTYHSLSLNTQQETSRLFDIPAGTHQPNALRRMRYQLSRHIPIPIVNLLPAVFSRTVPGLIGEGAGQPLLNPTMKSLMKHGGNFWKELQAYKQIPPETKEQKDLKTEVAIEDALRLVQGTHLDTAQARTFIRQALYAPLTINPRMIAEVWGEAALRKLGIKKGTSITLEGLAGKRHGIHADGTPRKPEDYGQEIAQAHAEYPVKKAEKGFTFFKTRGKSLETPFSGPHFLIFHKKRQYQKWVRAVTYCQKTRPPQPSTNA